MNENATPPVEVPNPPVPPAREAAPAPAAPPAAQLVVSGEANEETLQLRRELATARQAQREAETKASEAERVKQELLAVTHQEPAKPLPPPRRRFPTLLNHSWN